MSVTQQPRLLHFIEYHLPALPLVFAKGNWMRLCVGTSYTTVNKLIIDNERDGKTLCPQWLSLKRSVVNLADRRRWPIPLSSSLAVSVAYEDGSFIMTYYIFTKQRCPRQKRKNKKVRAKSLLNCSSFLPAVKKQIRGEWKCADSLEILLYKYWKKPSVKKKSPNFSHFQTCDCLTVTVSTYSC